MNVRIAALFGALSLVLAGCPGGEGQPDGGTGPAFDGSVANPGGCTGGCGPNQKCDENARKCVDMCNDTCGGGFVCVQQAGGNWACDLPQTSCAGSACGAGQTACVNDTCSCLPLEQASRDSCAQVGRVCREAWNAGTMTGGECQDPLVYEQCQPNCPAGQDCGVCQGDNVACNEVFSDMPGLCTHTCDAISSAGCPPGETCFGGLCLSSIYRQNSPFGCFQVDDAATADAGVPDGGAPILRESAATEPCIVQNDKGEPAEDPYAPTGTCTWFFISSETSKFPAPYCRTPGPVPAYGACTTEPYPRTDVAKCGSGLECVPNGTGYDGICMPICDVNDATACGADATCVNVYRFEDTGPVVGACMDTCNVFNGEANFGCPTSYGARGASCVPTSKEGTQFVTDNGDGICVPQRATVKTEGQPCGPIDAFDGAACASGLICSAFGDEPPACRKLCDVECAGSNPPARCAQIEDATCSGGRTCQPASSRTGSTIGYCI